MAKRLLGVLGTSVLLLTVACALPRYRDKRPSTADKTERDNRAETPLEQPSLEIPGNFKVVRAPFRKGTRFFLPNTADPGKIAIQEKIGLRFLLDLNVPYGTKVVAAENGKVIQVWEPHTRGGCDPTWEDSNHFIRIRHRDGTVAQYSHIRSKVRRGQRVRKGQVIGLTNKDGFICIPQLNFGVFKSEKHMANSPQRQSLPLFFENVKDGVPKPGRTYVVKQ